MKHKHNNQNRLKAGKKVEACFQPGWENLKMKDHPEIKERICKDLAWGEPMFYMVKRGERKVSRVQRQYLADLFADYGVSAFTGEEIEIQSAI